MRQYFNLLVLVAIFILAHPTTCSEIAYIMGPNDKIPVGQANITENKSHDVISFSVAADPRVPSTSYISTRYVDDIVDEINTKVSRGDKLVRDIGLDLVGNKSGARGIDQICSIYDNMVGKWTYVSDWRGLDEFQYSNYTLKKGIEVGSSGKGDCDDFAILLAALIESIGATPRVIFAYSPTGGHAYTEVYLGNENNRDVDRMLRWLRTAYDVNDINTHVNLETGDVWLNMDWWKDPGGSNHPGGPFYQATYQRPIYIRADEEPPLTINNSLPVASFSWTPPEPKVDEITSFSAAQSDDPDGKIMNYEWIFGDGGTGKGANKSACRHIYSESGKFNVNLTVTDNVGDTSCKTIEIIVSEPLPEAIAIHSPTNPKVGEFVTFDASQSKNERGHIIDYEWDFGDGYAGKGISIDHQYSKNGTYKAKITVINDKGVKNSSLINVTIGQEIETVELLPKGMARTQIEKQPSLTDPVPNLTAKNTSITWEKYIGGCYPNSIQQTNDDGYIIFGATAIDGYYPGNPPTFVTNPPARILLIKTDSSGYASWAKTFGDSISDSSRSAFNGQSIQQTNDGGYILAGHHSTLNETSINAETWLIKINSIGDKLWDKTFEDGVASSVQQTSDGGYIIAGSNARGAWLIKTDSSGDKLWDRTFEGGTASSVQQTSDGGYIMTGIKNTDKNENNYMWLIKTDSNGDKLWDKTFGGSEGDGGRFVQQTIDGGYVIIGSYGSYQTGDIWLFKTDSSGNRLWDRTFGGSDLDFAYSGQQTSDGGYIIAGGTRSFGNAYGKNSPWLIKTDSRGNKLWDKIFGGTENNTICAIQQTSDDGYVLITGWRIKWLIKTDVNGNI